MEAHTHHSGGRRTFTKSVAAFVGTSLLALGAGAIAPASASASATGPAATTTAYRVGAPVVKTKDNFRSYSRTLSLSDGDSFGPWNVVFAGYGSVTVTDATGGAMRLSPAVADDPSKTHAALVVSHDSHVAPNLRMVAKVRTTTQLRTGSAPNPWESAWVIWDYQDNDHFSYLAVKPNGWELGKRDPSYPGGQRFLATGSTPATGIGDWRNVKINRTTRTADKTVTVAKFGKTKLTRFVDRERPYTGGKVGVYTEDAVVDTARIKARSF